MKLFRPFRTGSLAAIGIEGNRSGKDVSDSIASDSNSSSYSNETAIGCVFRNWVLHRNVVASL